MFKRNKKARLRKNPKVNSYRDIVKERKRKDEVVDNEFKDLYHKNIRFLSDCIYRFSDMSIESDIRKNYYDMSEHGYDVTLPIAMKITDCFLDLIYKSKFKDYVKGCNLTHESFSERDNFYKYLIICEIHKSKIKEVRKGKRGEKLQQEIFSLLKGAKAFASDVIKKDINNIELFYVPIKLSLIITEDSRQYGTTKANILGN